MEENQWKFLGDQEPVYNVLMQGKNTFVAGAAGTGKTELIKKFAKDMRDAGKNVVVTAPTGLAAQQIDGVTFHRAFGYSIGPKNIRDLTGADIAKITSALQYADVIIIDEISMLRRDLFDLFFIQLLLVLKRRRQEYEAGVEKELKGIQLILVGDYHQLPPVYTGKNGQLYYLDGKKVSDKEYLKIVYGKDFDDDFPFQSENWNKLNLIYTGLHQIIRTDDIELSKAIKRLKHGIENTLDWFNDRCDIIDDIDFNDNKYDKHVILCGLKEEVRQINQRYLASINGKERTYKENIIKYDDSIVIGESDRIADQVVELKVGARVQCLINEKTNAYKNGSMGLVVDLGKDFAEVLLDEGKKVIVQVCKTTVNTYSLVGSKLEVTKVAEIEQIPLRLAKAMTVHKAQGQTFDNIIVKSDGFFTGAQYMVSLSRCRTLKGITLWGRLNNKRTYQSKYNKGSYTKEIKLVPFKVLDFYNEHKELGDDEDEL